MIIDGKKYSEEIKNEIKKEIIELKKKKCNTLFSGYSHREF